MADTATDDEIFRLRIEQRLPWRAIGQRVGLSHTQARTRFYAANPPISDEEREAIRDEENAKLDDLEARWLQSFARSQPRPDAEGKPIPGTGDEAALQRALVGLDRVHARRVKLNGVAMPIKIDLRTSSSDLRESFKTFRGLNEEEGAPDADGDG